MKNNYLLIFLVSICCFAGDDLKVISCFSLCAEFWDLEKPTPSDEEYKFFRHYVAQAQGPILEPMCGSGRYLIPLVQEGFEVDGFDASPFMINALRSKCKEKNLSAQVWEQFLEKMPTTKKYSLIFIPDTSFCFFNDLVHIKKNLKKIYDLLQSGGTFVFDVQTPHARWGDIGVWTGKAHKTARGDMIIENILPLPIKDSVSPMVLRYELVSDYKIVKTEVETYAARLYKPNQMEKLLRQAGFKKIKKIKAHNYKTTPSLDDEVVVFECKK